MSLRNALPKRFGNLIRRMFGTRNDRGEMTSSPAPAEGRAPVGTTEPAAAAKHAGAEAEAEAAAEAAAAAAAAAAAGAGAGAASATDQSPYSTRAGPTKVVEALEGQHSATVVWLHGLGDSGNGISNWLNMVWESVGEQGGNHLLDLPHVKWIFPSAPTAPVSVNRGHRSRSWYDIHAFNADAPVDAAGLDEAARYIAGILQEERRAHPDVTYIVGGISQGGRLSLYLMCRKALGSFANGSDASTLPFIASVGLSTWLPNCSLIPAPGETDAAVAERAARHPVFMAHGEVDPLIGYALGRASSDLLRNAGFSNLTFNSYPLLAHAMCGEELADMRAWLLQHAPLPAAPPA